MHAVRPLDEPYECGRKRIPPHFPKKLNARHFPIHEHLIGPYIPVFAADDTFLILQERVLEMFEEHKDHRDIGHLVRVGHGGKGFGGCGNTGGESPGIRRYQVAEAELARKSVLMNLRSRGAHAQPHLRGQIQQGYQNAQSAYEAAD